MSDSTNESAQNPILAGGDEPVAPEAEPATVSAETLTDDEVAATSIVVSPDEAAETTDNAEALEANAVVTPVMAGRGKRSADRPRRAPNRPDGPKPIGHFAVIETGGKQYRVSVGDKIAVERLEGDEGSEISLNRVLMIGGDGAPRIGAPMLDGVAVTATIENQYRGEKIVIFKMKPKKRYRRRTGHRQNLTRLSITAINA